MRIKGHVERITETRTINTIVFIKSEETASLEIPRRGGGGYKTILKRILRKQSVGMLFKVRSGDRPL